MTYYSALANELHQSSSLPQSALPIKKAMQQVLPPQISDWHSSLARWQQYECSPGNISPERIWVTSEGNVYFAFRPETTPEPLTQTGMAAEIAAWLVLLDCWMETFVVIARARSVWTPDELAGALTFLTPAFLPPPILQLKPNWEQVAEAVSISVADGPLPGNHRDRHWQNERKSDQTSVEAEESNGQSVSQRKSG